MTRRILVPRLVDESNVNAQNLNARALLARFSERHRWQCACYGKPDAAVSANSGVAISRLAPWRVWPWHMALFYQRPADAVFYPGADWFDSIGLKWRDRTRRHIRVIATLEGLVGNNEREEQVSRIAGHPVFCQILPVERFRRVDYILARADHIIAISPFLAKIARALYGDKCSVLPMGVDLGGFAPAQRPQSTPAPRVVSVGKVKAHKRPELFLDWAARHRNAEFCWIGEGELRGGLIAEAARRGLRNVSYPGALSRLRLADRLRAADIFVMPSRSEGVPKVTQEAAACGLPCIVFGYYEAPTVVNGENGFVVWSDEEFEQRLGELMQRPTMRIAMGRRSREMATAWDWSIVAPQWETHLSEIIAGQ